MINSVSPITISNNEQRVKKIVVMNPYLQGGHIATAEMESTARFIKAANKYDIDVKVCASHEEVEEYNPDFIFGITYQEPKLTKYPSYLSVNVAVSMIKDEPRFIRNILTYDAYLTLSPSVVSWLRTLCAENNKLSHIAPGYFTLPKTTFEPCAYENAIAMYMGTNWDGLRHKDLFTLLQSGDYLKCYGPKKSWESYPQTLYGGEVPFDGESPLKLYHRHAAGLCIGYPALDEEGIANNRMFEIPASGAVAICSENQLTKMIYDDSVIYLTKTTTTEELAEQIIAAVLWIRNNPEKSALMAKKAHQIYCEKYAMEVLLDKLLALHQRVCVSNGYNYNKDSVISFHHYKDPLLDEDIQVAPQPKIINVQKPNVAYLIYSQVIGYGIIPLLKSLQEQTYSDITVLIVTKFERKVKKILHEINSNLKIVFFNFNENQLEDKITLYLKENGIRWFGILSNEDKLFPNHTSTLIDRLLLQQHQDTDRVYSALYASSLEYSDAKIITDKICDQHKIVDYNKIRAGETYLSEKAPSCAFLFNVSVFPFSVLPQILTKRHALSQLVNQYLGENNLLASLETTCATNYERIQLFDLLEELDSNEDHFNTQEGLKEKILALQRELNQIYTSRAWQYAQRIKKIVNTYRKLKAKIWN